MALTRSEPKAGDVSIGQGYSLVQFLHSDQPKQQALEKRLEKDPFPGSGVFRVRVSGVLRGFSSQPLYATRTRHLIVYHIVQEDRVVILGLFSAKLKP